MNETDLQQAIDPMGRMNDPDGSAWITGLCGDTMEFYLVISHNTISQAWYHTDGCSSSRLCGSTAARLAQGKSVDEVLSISPGQILQMYPDLPSDGVHCSILAVSTLHKALAEWLLKVR
ncbi:MAG: iron-sulfur cluster assembly scaffold protein [Spirochaetales bacterium]|nr:iron-sulfur cluster assembly scaffold protein [Spirochaetales bacterium]